MSRPQSWLPRSLMQPPAGYSTWRSLPAPNNSQIGLTFGTVSQTPLTLKLKSVYGLLLKKGRGAIAATSSASSCVQSYCTPTPKPLRMISCRAGAAASTTASVTVEPR